ncbi:Rid family detoxifying hydrolase [Paucilactobacillus nenjiangensis]|jgi:2-iminobutanoate/2-iminopropanoate deaminase|uniref:RidA family protein n=1 Tax=Paucilactobacillus nenjiangensis TaxID=1296540 RepID=A0A5P1X3L1_9LACO|nr:Rid family detoxifying hydrolase [Paucilactobacillus nenjiangensis]QER66797.1 RidA family protein [Paucilactobacillus nenjiangensis]
MTEVIETKNAPAALGPYSQAIKVGNTLYGSGQVGIDPETGKLVGSDIESQTKQVFDNIAAVVAHAGFTRNDIVKTVIFLDDVNQFDKVNELYADFFSNNLILPARSTVEVSKLPAGALIEIEYVVSK